MAQQTGTTSSGRFTSIFMAVILLSTPLLAGAATGAGAAATHRRAHRHAYQTPLLHALDDLDLTATQQLELQAIVSDGSVQAAAEDSGNDYIALNNPGDPGHATAIRAEQSRAANLILRRDAQDTKIYALLTPEQRARLPATLAQTRNIYLPGEKPHIEMHKQKSGT